MYIGSNYSPLNFQAKIKIKGCNETKIVNSIEGTASAATGLASGAAAFTAMDAVLGDIDNTNVDYCPSAYSFYNTVYFSNDVSVNDNNVFDTASELLIPSYSLGLSGIGMFGEALDRFSASASLGDDVDDFSSKFDDEDIPD